jgi:group I intron endonuclease
MKKYNYVYITTNLVNGRQYIGSHCTDNIDDGYLGSGRYFVKAVKKYRKENFVREVLQECENIEEARKLEEGYISKYNTLRPIGYNLSPTGGQWLGSYMSQESIEKMRKKRIGQNAGEKHHYFNKKRSKEDRNNISKGLTGLHQGEEHRNNLSKASLSVKRTMCEHCGKEFTPWGLSRHKTYLRSKYII